MSSHNDKAPSLRRRAILWLLLLGPFFFISYGGANWYASLQPEVGHIAFDWERQIPFVPWTIIPYWVIDFFYALSLFLCTSKTELDTHARRLLAAQVIAVGCFLLFPLQFSFERPQADGLFGGMFAALYSFDQPFNQVPSLHITLLVILWTTYRAHLPRRFQWLLHFVSALIAVSVLTTYQHHFIDIPTGALLGWFCIWLWPDDGASMWRSAQIAQAPGSRKMAGLYLLAALVSGSVGLAADGALLWLLWPAISLLLVAMNYGVFGSRGFQKDTRGQMSVAAKWLLFPYLIGAWVNSRLWTLRSPSAVPVADSVWLGRFPSRKDMRNGGYLAVVDMAAELPAPKPAPTRGARWCALPCLDLLLPPVDVLLAAADLIENRCQQEKGPVLVVCALGFSRSAMAVTAWLLRSKRVESVDAAIEMIRVRRPEIVLGEVHRQRLQELVDG